MPKAKSVEGGALAFTVVLIYPDYAAAQFGTDSYVARLWADDARQAIRRARSAARAASVADVAVASQDFAVAAIFDGHGTVVHDPERHAAHPERDAAAVEARRLAGKDAALLAVLRRELRDALEIAYGCEMNWPESACRALGAPATLHH
ncbi:MAG: hypothetical protein EOM91_22030 [Sphingobacteriia bacterium]|nr:hypothetical protein [Sphingobacteriia bacterium]